MEHIGADGAMVEEFSTLPLWTAEAVERLGPEFALPAGCRGSGTPEALRWLCRTMRLGLGDGLLDVGAGEGGPAALAAHEFGVAPVLVDPMPGACVAARRMFGHPTAVAGAERLPFASGWFGAVWSIAVLCTVEDKSSVLEEARRVLRPGGMLGLLVYVRTVEELPEQPDGNSFPSPVDLSSLLDDAGFEVIASAALADFPDPPRDWSRRVDAVDRAIAQAHEGDSRLATATEQQEVIGRLIADGLVDGRLMVARAADAPEPAG